MVEAIVPSQIPADYDPYILEFNWLRYFTQVVGFWFALSVAARTVLPKPGSLKEFVQKGQEKDYRFYLSQYVSLMHAVLAIVFSVYVLLCTDSKPNSATTFYQYLVIYGSTAYFLVDEIMETFDGTSDFLTHLHHVAVLWGGLNFMLDHYGGHEYMLMLIAAEVSNPFLILRTMFKTIKYEQGLLLEIIEYAFAISFVLCRTLITNWIEFVMYEGENVGVYAKLCISFVNFIQQYWVIKIVLMWLNRQKKGAEEKGEKFSFPLAKARGLILYILNDNFGVILFAFFNLFFTTLLPVWYYHCVRGNLTHNLGPILYPLFN